MVVISHKFQVQICWEIVGVEIWNWIGNYGNIGNGIGNYGNRNRIWIGERRMRRDRRLYETETDKEKEKEKEKQKGVEVCS